MTTAKTPPTVSPAANLVVRALLRSPLHRVMSGATMILSLTGRKTGRAYTFPVRYERHGDTITCYTDSAWWKNLRGGAPVTMLVKRRRLHGIAEPVTDEQAVADSLLGFLRRTPRDSKYYGVRRDPTGRPDPHSVARAAGRTVMVTIQLTSPAP
ncbi:nitroreductase/quinone reductase family protein [Nonomuraea endophytica]|uniref:DUF385 domain-containing protein n=1 Tax=Nonomuraea endophytica TaxID=714136 RepID=A0A7W8EDY4_9ACTN|nr:nitroreductase/quinone reductase family protein [Nonomuraea endophytica]MBB5075791.1 hypothetical protein [Nonomuraea endophytica]